MKIEVKRLPIAEDLPIPYYASDGAAGMDIVAAQSMLIPAGEYRAVQTGISVAIPDGYEIQFRPRSGLAFKHGITVLNSPGTIDSDYRGELIAILINHGKSDYMINKTDRIAQLVVNKVERADIDLVLELSPTSRGEGGFGSTGR